MRKSNDIRFTITGLMLGIIEGCVLGLVVSGVIATLLYRDTTDHSLDMLGLGGRFTWIARFLTGGFYGSIAGIVIGIYHGHIWSFLRKLSLPIKIIVIFAVPLIALFICFLGISLRPDINMAARKDNILMVQTSLILGENINKPDSEGMTPLRWAAKEGRLDMVKFILNHGANVNGLGDYQGKLPVSTKSALIDAAENDHPEIVKYLISRGADSQYIFPQCKTGLIYAIDHNYIDVIQAWIEAGGSLKLFECSDTPFNYAQRHGSPRAVELLKTVQAVQHLQP